MQYKAKYSGPGKIGICICGCSWENHHLMLVAQDLYIQETNEYYIPGECVAYGSNESGGMKLNENGEWEDHCFGYRDKNEV